MASASSTIDRRVGAIFRMADRVIEGTAPVGALHRAVGGLTAGLVEVEVPDDPDELFRRFGEVLERLENELTPTDQRRSTDG